MTKKQKIWAASHDWYVRDSEHGVIVAERFAHDDTVNTLEFTDFQKLRDWAGY